MKVAAAGMKALQAYPKTNHLIVTAESHPSKRRVIRRTTNRQSVTETIRHRPKTNTVHRRAAKAAAIALIRTKEATMTSATKSIVRKLKNRHLKTTIMQFITNRNHVNDRVPRIQTMEPIRAVAMQLHHHMSRSNRTIQKAMNKRVAAVKMARRHQLTNCPQQSCLQMFPITLRSL